MEFLCISTKGLIQCAAALEREAFHIASHIKELNGNYKRGIFNEWIFFPYRKTHGIANFKGNFLFLRKSTNREKVVQGVSRMIWEIKTCSLYAKATVNIVPIHIPAL